MSTTGTSAPRARRALLARVSLCAGLVLLASSSPVLAAAPPTERYLVDVRVIEGSRDGTGEVDAKLGALARDLKTLPFKTFRLRDAQTSLVSEGERISLEIPGAALQQKGKKATRFLVVSAHGRQAGGKLRFSLGIDALKFETLVAVPEGGTIIVGGPRGENGNAVLFAFTARTQR
jgi:hypothetical protein